MAHVPVPADLPGIVSLFAFRPEHAGPLNALAEALLRGPSSLTSGERELIATATSARNRTTFCVKSHAAAAAVHLGGRTRVDAVIGGGSKAEADPKLRALLAIAEAVADSPQGVTDALVAVARAAGADDIAIHDAVLIASAFCMFNRYVDGLATFAPPDDAAYGPTGERLAKEGYSWPPPVPATV